MDRTIFYEKQFELKLFKVDWSIPCEDIWTIIEADTLEELAAKFRKVVFDGVKLDVREFESYSMILTVYPHVIFQLAQEPRIKNCGEVRDFIQKFPDVAEYAKSERKRQMEEERRMYTRENIELL